MDKRISQLDLVTELDGNDVLPIVNDGVTKKVKISQLPSSETNLSYLPDPANGVIDNDNGTSATIPLTTSTDAGLFSPAEKTKLAGIETGAQANVNADWNATTGDAQILNKPSIPSAQVNSDWNSTSGVSQILNKPTIPTNTSDLTNDGADGVNPFITALDIPTTGQASTLVREVKNMTGATLTKGTIVFISGANGNKPLVSKAIATTDALSARTFGLLQSNISNNGLGYCVIIGDLSGLDTSSFSEGDQLYLSGVTAGTYTATRTLAPTHLVYVGKVTRSHPTQGQIEVGIQNGYELSEIHDVALSSEADKQLLSYEASTDLWKNKSASTLGIETKSTSAYSMKVNNTNATADATETTYRNKGIAVYTGGIVFTATTSPSGTTNHSYNWLQIGNLVTLNLNIYFSTAGVSVQNMTMAFPTDCPTPLIQTGMPNSALTKHYIGSGRMSAGVGSQSSNPAPECNLRKNNTNTGFEIYLQQTAGSFNLFQVTIQYFT